MNDVVTAVAPEHPRVEIRFYDQFGESRRLLSKDSAVAAARWKTTRYGGYSDADFTLAGTLESLTVSDSATGVQPVRENDRVRVFVDNSLRWSGKVRELSRSVGAPNSIRLQATGMFADIAEVPVDGRFISPYPVDVSQAFASFLYVEAVAAFPNLFVDIEDADVGVTVQAEDAFNKNLGGALSGLAERFGGRVVYGCDERYGIVGAGTVFPLVDRIYLRNVGSTTSPDYTFDVPGGFNTTFFEMAEGGKDLTRLANSLTITGPSALYPNYLGDACNGNVGFERPVFADFASNPLVLDFSFEFSSWSYNSGATQKTGSIEGIPARSGAKYAELDAVNENVSQTITTALTAGDTLVVGVNARREDANYGGTFRIRVQFKNGGADVGSPYDATFSPATVYWQEYSNQILVPAGTITGFVLTYTATVSSGTGRGINLDDAFAYRAFVRQDGWFLVAEGTATKNARDFAHTADKTQGRYSVKIDVTASDSDGNDAYFQPGGKFAVTAGAILEFGCDIRAFDGVTNGKLRLDFRFYDEDGGEVSGSGDFETFAAGTINSTWRQIRNTATVPTGAALCLVRVTFRGSSQVYLDRMYVRDTAAPIVDVITGEREWIDSGPYRIQIDTNDGAFTSKTYYNSIDTYGRRYEQIQSDGVVDRVSAYAVAQAYFDTYALPLARPQLRIQGSPITFKCGQTVRIAGAAGEWLGNERVGTEGTLAYPIAEIEESVDNSGRVTTLLSLEIEPPSQLATISRLFDKKRKATTGGGVSAIASSAVGGGGTSASLALPVSVANGGTAATTAADARTNLGLGSGLSVTITTAKLTGGGADGSMTFVNGVLTAQTAAT